MSAKQQFIRDLQQDRDYIEHKKNCIMDNFMSYHPASVDNDIYRLTDESSIDETGHMACLNQ